LSASNFSVTENGKPVSTLTVQPLFQGQTQAVSVALVMDVSGSTAGAAHADAINAAKQFLASLPPTVQVELIAFSDKAAVKQAFTTNRGALDGALNGLGAGGSTALYDAISLAANDLSRQVNGQHNIVVFTDGTDTVSKTTLAGAQNAIRSVSAPTTGVLLNTSQVDPTALRSITDSVKGGRFLQVTDRAQLASSFAQAAQAIASQYVLSYPSVATTPSQLTLVVTANVGGATNSDSSVVLNARKNPGGAAPIPTAAPVTPVVGVFGGKTGLYIGAAAVFLGALLFIGMLLYRPAGAEAERMLQRRLRLYTRSRDKKKQKEQQQEGLLGGTAIGRKAVELAEKVPRSQQFDEKLQKELDQAGWLLRSTEFILLQVGGAIVGLALGWGLLARLWLGIVFLVLGAMAPRVILSNRITKRTSAFLTQLPDTLQLLAGSLQAGYGFMQALDTCAKEAIEPTSTEFARVLSESRLGMPVEDALEAMADRVGGEDFRWVVMAINIQRQVGGNLATLLTTVANTLREREQVRRQIKVLSAEGRLSAIILVILPFALVGYLSVVNPNYLHQLTSATIGKIAIMIALALIGIGSIWMRKIIKIDV
jgi:tight adherence protein B